MSSHDGTLKKLHTRLVDSVDGYEQARSQLDGDHGHFVDRVLEERRAMHRSVHSKLTEAGISVDDDGSTAAALHRQVFKLRDAIASGDANVLAECARGDGYLVEAYDDAIEATEGEPNWNFLVEQRARVAAARQEAETLSS